MDVKIEQSWKDALSAEFDKDYFIKLTDFVRGEYLAGKTVYPEPQNIFNAFKQISTSVSSNQEQPYSTVPIGLGIAASGISAAAGTVLVDSMYSNDSKNEKIENLDDYENEEEKQVQDNESESKYEMDEIPTPYHASRDKIIVNKFYEGNEDSNEEFEDLEGNDITEQVASNPVIEIPTDELG